ncbi:adhesion G-protein coupled receptor g4-like [Plakobranchus ocellatus]|uniref:Adhesion G-protein coupled receptor g4-like n=1 Tax=Plakobranchus ocellatus TaxID=259542 RepID=A0AAV4C844_9GAST|nr:adhesion G-protein coupled receptor g4-like [Plakobranchus ocellatus]
MVLFPFSNSSQSSYIVSWPCDAQLRVLCQFDKTYPDQTPPQMKATINSNLIRNKGSDILAHSDVIRLIGGAQPTSPVNVGPGEPPIDDQSLQIKCSLPFLNTLQSATIYKSGVAVNVYEGQRFNRVDQLEHSVDLSIDEIPDFPGSYNIIDSAVSYSCDYNDASSGRLLSSNSLFVRPTDFEILSVHFYLVRNQRVIDWPTAILWSLLNFWPVENEGGDLGPQRRQADGNTEQVLREIGLAFADSGYQLTPVQLRDQGPDSDGVLIMRAYMKIDSSDSSVFTDVPQNDQALKYLQEYAKDSLTDLGEIGVTKIEVFSIDWCWATKRTVAEVDQEYDIPITRAPGVWRSPQICARDNAPLVTIECRGNKREGFSWGPTQINSLCNYGSQEGGTESSITDDLQDLSQADVTPDNVNTTVTNLKTLVESVDPDDITPTDVNYIADVLQKATTTGGDLGPEVVSDILQTVNDMSQLPVDVLGDGQRLGNSSNRILQAADKAGSLLKIPAGSTQERLVSGGVGLEVWDIAQKSSDSSVIVGIKMLSDGSQEVVAFEELVSQFSDSQVEYVGTQAAIYLPEEFIRTYTNNNSNTEVRLSMNVYKVTNLYRDPSFGQDDGVNRTLNSRVIAAQLLVGGEEITDLGGYKVLTVFEPTVYVLPSEERPNRTTCVYWDFSANEGAGGWSSDGCIYGRTTEGRDLCECDHLTNFAVLVSFYDQSELEHKEILGYITIVGLSLSIAGLAMSMLSFIFIR